MNENQRLFAELIRRYDEMGARLAAAERVVEAARALIPGASSFLYNSPYRARYNDLREATEAYSDKGESNG